MEDRPQTVWCLDKCFDAEILLGGLKSSRSLSLGKNKLCRHYSTEIKKENSIWAIIGNIKE
jgi:hypothetical protein